MVNGYKVSNRVLILGMPHFSTKAIETSGF